MKRFDRLYKTIFESVEPTKKKVIKEEEELGYVPSDDQIKEEVKSIMENVDFDLPLSTNWERLTRSLVRKVLKDLSGQRFVDRDDFHYACYDTITDIIYANESKNVDRSKKVIRESARRHVRRIRK